MADIKFMDISENDNPATTDSILVGNQDNGVKRTTLGKIGDMFAVHSLLHFEKLGITIDKPVQNFKVNAPTVEGYNFAFWLSSASVGMTDGTYIEDPLNANTQIWFTQEALDSPNFASNVVGKSVQVIAVYVKSIVA